MYICELYVYMLQLKGWVHHVGMCVCFLWWCQEWGSWGSRVYRKLGLGGLFSPVMSWLDVQEGGIPDCAGGTCSRKIQVMMQVMWALSNRPSHNNNIVGWHGLPERERDPSLKQCIDAPINSKNGPGIHRKWHHHDKSRISLPGPLDQQLLERTYSFWQRFLRCRCR
jgi:hypothetical protein